MPSENINSLSPPLIVYLVMGLVTARILLAKSVPRSRSLINWLRFIVKAGSFTLLWPLVLFIRNFEAWLRGNE